MNLVCGIDEAGRGPVIGPLVICGAMIEDKAIDELKKMKIKESKQLTPKQRREFFVRLKDVVRYKAIEIWPNEIDEAVGKKDGMNLNWLEAKKSAEIINELNPNIVIVDCPSPNTKRYKDYLKGLIKKKDVEIITEHKADVKYEIVAAASIIAKVIRDKEIRLLEKKYGKIGSGYPADPITKEFTKKNWDKHPEIFRKSWTTFQRMKEKERNVQKKVFDF